MKKLSLVLGTAVVTLLFVGTTSSVFAYSSEWAKEQPRRNQVNKRLNNQKKRIIEKVGEGEISNGEARKLHREDRAIRQEEKDMARQNGGHITDGEQKVLNQQENAVSREIGK